jgi:hypothetical protein
MCPYGPASPVSPACSMVATASGYRFGQGVLYSPKVAPPSTTAAAAGSASLTARDNTRSWAR